ncbi:MAG: hypothetical protein LBO70_04975 [Clostridiales Family XIII bacterium]|nr:hypothetical protein [Clostridiales Family XIII bacterium]
MKKKKEDLGQSLCDEYARWEHLNEYGGHDPFYSDGVNMNLVRNHIIYYKRQIKESCDEGSYPDAYYRPLPPEADHGYIARKNEILDNAKLSLEKYKTSEDYLYILAHRYDFTEKTASKLCIPNVLGYVTGLEDAIRDGDYITMRRHENYESYLGSFRDLAGKMAQTPAESVQMTFDSYAAADVPNEGPAPQMTL